MMGDKPDEPQRHIESALRAAVAAAQERASVNRASRNSAFRLNADFIRDLAEWYSDDVTPIESSSSGWRPTFPKRRVMQHVRSLLEESFWASLRTEEGRPHNFELKYGPPGEWNQSHRDAIVLDESLPFNSRKLAKLAPALHRNQVIGVWPRDVATGRGDLVIWGFTQGSGPLSVRVIEPGKIIASVGIEGKAGIDGQRADFVSSFAIALLREVFAKARRSDSQQDAYLVEVFRSADLKIIARSMRAHGSGGTLLIVRDYDESLIDRTGYTVKPDETFKVYLTARDSMLREGGLGGDTKDFREFLESIGQLTAVDGATMVTYDLCLGAFGIKVRPKNSDAFTIRHSGPFDHSELRIENSRDTDWGTRHQSAAQFIFDKRDALAIVASHDGKLSVFMWDEANQAVSVTEEAEFLLL